MENIQKNLLSIHFLNHENQCAASRYINSLFSEKSQVIGGKRRRGRKERDGIYLKILEFENLLLQTTTRRESGQLTWKILEVLDNIQETSNMVFYSYHQHTQWIC